MSYGEYLKSLRIEKGISLREMAKKTEIDVAYLSRVERSVCNPPMKEEITDKISEVLKLTNEKITKLKDAASVENGKFPKDVKENLSEYKAIPILLRTIGNKKLTEDQIVNLTKFIQKEY